ncbi:MAG: trypsin-like serine protease [Sandaracinaceae bacterium]|nr:trypsin-like serine protease [Sandaracinaceae bacterium]
MRRAVLLVPLSLTLASFGCDGEDPVDASIEVDAAVAPADGAAPPPDAGAPAPDASFPACGPDERTTRLVYYGTELPTLVPLTPGQILAVVDFSGCSGAFVTDEWVLTARHCGVAVGRRFCVGPDPRNANVCFTADRVENHPSVDMTLVHANAPASSRIAELVPIPIITETIDGTWIGRMAEAAGYGTQEDGRSGEREFTAEPIVRLDGPYAVIDGQGMRGVCFGDSGGPLMVLASDSTVRVLGTLSFGDPSCVGQDSYTRTDLQLPWIEAILGPIVVDGAPCGRIAPTGDCVGSRTAVWCDLASGLLESETCASGTACGWDATASAYRCVTEDPCGGISAAGRCEGGTASWCDMGTVRRRECAACGELCRYVGDVGGFYCRPDPCVGIDPQGVCEGDVLTTCDPDVGVQTENCAARGRVCGFSERRGAYRCIRG